MLLTQPGPHPEPPYTIKTKLQEERKLNTLQLLRHQHDSVIQLHAMYVLSLLGLLAKIEVLGVLPAHLPLVLDAGILVSVPPASCGDFVCCHCTWRWAVLDNTHGKDSGAFRCGLLSSHYHGPYS